MQSSSRLLTLEAPRALAVHSVITSHSVLTSVRTIGDGCLGYIAPLHHSSAGEQNMNMSSLQ